MALISVHPWQGFFSGLLVGCWIGVVMGSLVTLLLVGRRVRQLETINHLLRSRLRSHDTPRKTGTGGPPIVLPLPGAGRSSPIPITRRIRSL